jgi:hypothetical protein
MKEGQMIRTAAVVVVIAAITGLTVAGMASATSPNLTHPTAIHVIDKGQFDVLRDVPPTGVSEGDLFVFADEIVSPRNHGRVLGRIDGVCVLMIVANHRFECHSTHTLNGRGTITTEGVFVDKPGHVNVFAVNGGTGDFRNARGQATFSPISIGQDETLHLIP